MDKASKPEKKKWYEYGFFRKILHDKFYLLSFVVTFVFLGFISFNALNKSEGWISKRKKSAKIAEKILKTGSIDLSKINGSESVTNNLQVDNFISNGFYSHRFSLNRTVTINNCTVREYQLIYQIDNDVTNKYFYNQCLGYKKIDTGIINFSDDTVVEKGIVYKSIKDVDIGISMIDNVYFYGNNFIVLKDDNLVLVNEDKVYSNNDLYPNNGNSDIKRYYKVGEYKYKFIVFNDNLPLCPVEFNNDDIMYTIYEIEYDKENKKMKDASVIIERYSKDFCDNYEKDMEVLKQ